MAIFGNKSKSGDFTINFAAVGNSLPGIADGSPISATISSNDLVFAERLGKREVRLPINRIDGFELTTEKDVIEKQKSSLGRAAVGGVLLGPLGAVVGAVDGTGTKKQTRYRKLGVFYYTTAEGDASTITVEINGSTFGLKKFEEALGVGKASSKSITL